MKTSWVWVYAVLALCCTWKQSCEAHQEHQSCTASKGSSIKFSVKSHRNQTGQWVSKVQVHLTPEQQKRNLQWSVDVEQSSMECDGSTTLLLEAEISAQASSDYEYFPGVGYYKFYGNPVSWHKAKAVCEDEGAHLAIVNSEEESKALAQLFSRQPAVVGSPENDVASIGFHDMDEEGDYRTIFGEPLAATGFIRWYPGYRSPDNYEGSDTHPGEDCGSIQKGGLLNDINCDYVHAFICEKELPKSKQSSL